MRTMVDSTNIADEPAADLVAYYCDGLYAISEAAVRVRFPNAIPVSISAIGTNCGVVGDVEPGCMDPQYAVGWVQQRRAAGIDPTIYCNELHGWTDIHGGIGPVRLAFINAGIPEPHYWTANYSRPAGIRNGTVAHQYANPTLTGGHFDRSVVADFWPGVDGVFGPGGGSGGIDLATADDIMAELNIIHQGLFGKDPAVLTPPIQDQLAMVYTQLKTPVTVGGVADLLLNRTQTILDNLAKLAVAAPGAGLTAQQQQLLQEVHDMAVRIKTALKDA